MFLTLTTLYRTIGTVWQWHSIDTFDATFANFWEDTFSWPHKAPRYPLDVFRSVLPVPCHSHNDYWRRTPLFAALGSGCVSIEADIWSYGGDLLVGHTQWTLNQNITLQTMYIDHLVGILETVNAPTILSKSRAEPLGVFYADPKQTLTLLVDFKTTDLETWTLLHQQLQPLRERGYLTHWNGTHRVERPITIVASGGADFNLIVANRTYRDIFLDAPLDALEDESDDPPASIFKYNSSNSHFASVNFAKSLGVVLHSTLSDKQTERLRNQIRNARERNLVPRYWGTPRWPRGLRDAIWAVLIQEQIGLLNVDDLRAVRKGQWGLWT